MAQLKQVVQRDGVQMISIPEDYLWLAIDECDEPDPESKTRLDPKAMGMLLAYLEYVSRRAATYKGFSDRETVEEIHIGTRRFIGERAINVHVRHLAKRGWIHVHRADKGHGNTLTYSLNVSTIQTALDNMQTLGDHDFWRDRYNEFMEGKLAQKPRQIPLQPAEPSPELLAAAETAAQFCPGAESNRCLLVNSCGRADASARVRESRMPEPPERPTAESRATLHGIPSSRGAKTALIEGAARAVVEAPAPPSPPTPALDPVYQWLVDIGVAVNVAQEFVQKHPEDTLRKWWEWAPYGAEQVDDRVAMFVTIVRQEWQRPPGRYTKAVKARAAGDQVGVEQAARARELEESKKRQEEEERANEAFFAQLDPDQRARFDAEVDEEFQKNSFVYGLYKQAVDAGKEPGQVALGTLNTIRRELIQKWRSGS